ncbi:hypothetical protein VNO77_30359 [Canavalia gladiata]|uniref:Uncharacterized protein n=1 Tax=Canavalia gladiata TaxID=3824 RepID=A0AAN9KR01_CANGL
MMHVSYAVTVLGVFCLKFLPSVLSKLRIHRKTTWGFICKSSRMYCDELVVFEILFIFANTMLALIT